MANFNEVYLAISWISATLSGDSTMVSLAPGGFWRGKVPQTLENSAIQSPLIIYAHQGGPGAITTMNGLRLFSDMLFQIVAAGPESNYTAIAQAAAYFDRLFGGPPNGPVSGPVLAPAGSGLMGNVGWVLDCYQQQPLLLDLEENGEPWVKNGGLYKLQLQQIAS